ncbi:hypothetical protein EV702DRAFT_1042436 [Suillus placidus]|uniref:DUF6830 domain-containing protein n=1 Tax=Suillus placidus TaxID=48579 RepID=A0A9P7D6J7_9AGAM|nr:hypothetical protein EV702DRAFT_1042436 [Suillus placidus]
MSKPSSPQWCIRIVGVEEFDFCFSVLQPLMTFQHFKQDISMLKQVTGRVQWDIQCYLVAVIVNAAPLGIIIAVRTLMDFRYLSQVVTIDGKQCQKILNALKTFYDHKHEIIAHGGHWGAKSKDILDNWYILNLKLMQSVVPSIYQQSQMRTATVGYRDDLDDGVNMTRRLMRQAISRLPSVICGGQTPRPLCTFIVGSTAIHLNFDPSLQRQAIDNVAKKFCLPDLQEALADYIQRKGQTVQTLHKLTGQHRASPNADLPFKHLNIWCKVCMQQTPCHSGSAPAYPRTIMLSSQNVLKK